MRRIWRHGNGSVHLQFYMICSSLLSLDDGNINDLQSTRYGWEYLDDSMKYMKMLNLIPDAINFVLPASVRYLEFAGNHRPSSQTIVIVLIVRTYRIISLPSIYILMIN